VNEPSAISKTSLFWAVIHQRSQSMSSLYNEKSSMSGALTNGNVQQPAVPRYVNVQEIGKGAYSAVYKGRDRQKEGRYVAMKEVRIPLNSEEGIPMTTVREIGLLRQLDKYENPNVVRYCHYNVYYWRLCYCIGTYCREDEAHVVSKNLPSDY